MQVTGTRQQAAWQRAEFPPVEKVAGGFWSVPVPIIGNPLRYVLSYLIEHDAGFVMVDPGWNHPDSWLALTSGLAECGVPLGAITGILVTHVHPDHHGLSARVREQSGAWVGMHPAEDAFLDVRGEAAMRSGMEYYLRWCGAPEAHLRELVSSRQHTAQVEPMARADRLVEHGDRIDVPGLRLRAVWTPGHTPGHLCFHDEARDLLLTGDHILPRITPNVSAYDMTSNPLEDYLASLEKIRGIQPSEVLPAHEYRFADLDSRLTDLTEHHRERLAEAERGLIAAGPAGTTAWQAAKGVTWSRPWADLVSFQRQAAIGEVLSHLRYLQARGHAAESDIDGVGIWTADS
ncbi:MAG TPA: MBL fold metallo-hydrolase [Streptosporangiaceae bacterium]|nr:MBL fold metallo-hydrolase [Streptosporangiaceae bacterium]